MKNCLCHLSPVFKGETDPSRQKDRVKKGGDEWLGELSHHERCRVLGVEGAKAWESGQEDWRENMRGYSAAVMGTRIKFPAGGGQCEGGSGIIERKGGADTGMVEQAKKRDHKIFITDIAIDKVPYVYVPGLPENVCKAIKEEHQAILRMAKNENDSNEILSLMSKNLSEMPVRVPGDEFGADPNTNPKAVSLFNRSGRQEIMYLHNHPSTNKFSLADIMEFVRYGNIGLLSVVTNQGEVNIIYKSDKYDFKKASEIFDDVHKRYNQNELSHKDAVDKFLKSCREGGIIYAKSH